MNTIQALQELYLKLGGSLADTYSDIAGGVAVGEYVLIPDMIAACAQIAESGGGGGGGGAFVINVESSVMDKTWQEIYDAVDAGKVCAVKGESVEGQAEIGYVTSIFSVMGTYTVVCITTDTINAAVSEYAANAAGGYPAYVGTYTGALPAVSSADNGNVLTVVNGAWGKAAPSGGALVVDYIDDETTGDRLGGTWQEIHDAMPTVWASVEGMINCPIVGCGYDEESGEYVCLLYIIQDPTHPIAYFVTSSADGYPTISQGE